MTDATSSDEKDVLIDALNSMEEALVVYDANGCLLSCNRSFLQMYGYSAEQASPGVHYRQLGEIDIRQGNVAVEDEDGGDYLERKAAYRQTLKGSFTVKLQDGRWIRTTDRAIPGGGFVSVHVDVTELKDAQEKMRIAQQLAQAHEQQLAILNENLEQQVEERTRELEEAIAVAEKQARTDPLTGFRNRRAFFESAEVIHESARRYAKPYTVIMLDIDRFKKVNDSRGHLVGDRIIRQLAEILEKEIRTVDVAGRLGGDEFAAILPETTIDNAAILADRLLNSFSAGSLTIDNEDISVSVSIGIAEFIESDKNVEATLLRADSALYDAKAQGRNRFVSG